MFTRKNLSAIILTIVCGVWARLAIAGAPYIYVDDSATGANDGSSWENAFNYLQDALEVAEAGDEIRVAQGTYRPDRGDEVSTGDRTAAFDMIGGATMKGGYAGFGAPNPDLRDCEACKTILSGDLEGNDVEVAFARDLLTEPTRADNSFHLLSVASGTPVIEGFTIEGASDRAMYMYYSDAVVTDCVFEGNAAGDSGGAAYIRNGRAIFTRCSFLNNAAAEEGGAICSDGCGTCRSMYEAYVDCVFTGNYAGSRGGAVCNKSTTLSTFANCLFTANNAQTSGAALYEDSYDNLGSHLLNCTFSGNNCIAIYVTQYGYAALSNCILYDNLCGTNGGFNAQITRERTTGTNMVIVDHCCIEGWDGSLGGTGNFDADPRFLAPGTWDPDLNYAPGDYRLQSDSPCIDAGYPGYTASPHNITIPTAYYFPGNTNLGDYIIKSTEQDLDGNPRMVGSRVDAGPYEWDSASLNVIYVDDNATGANNGSSWEDAFNYLQDALDAVPADREIWVAQGTYRPDQGDEVSTGDRDATFNITGNIVIKGGYAGFGRAEPYARDFEEYETILSGDLARNDAGPAYARDLLGDGTRTDNSYSVVTVNGDSEDNAPTLEGFTITGGNTFSQGAGLFINHCNAVITDCIFIENSSNDYGGGFASDNGRAIFTRCSFIRNAAYLDGGAVYIDGCGTCRSMYGAFIDCIFEGNYARTHGGAVCSKSVTLTTYLNCLFTGNTAESSGAALYEASGNLGSHLVNCTFAGNNCTAIYVTEYGFANFSNCILWGNRCGENTGLGAQITSEETGTAGVVINYSCVQGWDGSLGGTGNFDADPRFVSSGTWDIDLNYNPGDYHLRYNSPCVDAGDPGYTPEPTSVIMPTGYYINEVNPDYLATSSLTDLGGVPRLAGSSVDAGAYEGTLIPSVYVDDTATGANNGSSWEDAFNYLQDALEAAPPGHEIRVAQGTYRPDRGARVAPGDRNATFQCETGVIIRGGYAGTGTPNPNARNINEYNTILTGDLADNDESIADPADLIGHPSRSDNSYHVVTIGVGVENVTIDGLTITGGNANQGAYPDTTANGGGIYKRYSSGAIMTNCTIIANSANFEGGGMYNAGSLKMDKCRFIGNAAESGGGMESSTSWEEPMTNCLFTGNFAASDGGAIATKCSALRCTNCTFTLNRAAGDGFYRGGGITGDDDTDMWLTNCIFWGNTDVDGAVESSQIWQDYISQTRVNYCCVQGWTGILGGQGNFGSDPLFLDPDGQDNVAGTEDDNVRLTPASPCIDAGDPEYSPPPGQTDLDGNPRILDGRVDMGPYEKPGTESKTIYVDDSAIGNNDGSNWQNAFNYLQDAIEAALPGDEIRVAQGTYRPDLGDEVSIGDPDAAFRLKSRLTIKGGYKGFGAPDPDTRDFLTCASLLSGDLADNDIELAHARNLLTEPTRNDNSYCIIRADNSLVTAPTIDGFTIRGAANGAMDVGTQKCDVVVTDCVFRDNRAEEYGGAISLHNSIVIFTRCSFLRNAAGNKGAAIYAGGGGTCRRAQIDFFDCIFRENYSGEHGGAIYTTGDTITIASDCLFAGNTAGHIGAALYQNTYDSGSFLSNCTFSGNNCIAVYITEEGHAEFTSCILYNNICGTWAGQDAQITLQQPAAKGTSPGSVIVDYSLVEGWDDSLGGTGNFDEDPRFVSPGEWDDSLNFTVGDYRLKQDSPCIDAGDPTRIPEPNDADLDGLPRLTGSKVDIGAYEYNPDLPPYTIIYVDDSATGANDGSSWQNAFRYLQDALAETETGDEIRVAQGTYRPDLGDEVSTGDRDAKFDIGGIKMIRAGYAGSGAPDPGERDIERFVTILSGDLAGNDVHVDSAGDLLAEPTRADNTHTILFSDASGTGQPPIVEGFTIIGANSDSQGGGLFINHDDIIVKDCTFVENTARNRGGAMAFDNSRIIFERCSFIRNAAGESGGAIYMDGCGTCRSMYGAFVDCVFTDNYAGQYGGAIYNTSASMATSINSLFIGNKASDRGGAVYNNAGWLGAHFMNCTFVGNECTAFYNTKYGTASFTNCVLSNNLCGTQTGFDAQLAWEERDWQYNTPIVNHCCIDGWDGSIPGVGNFTADPQFVSPGSWDLELNFTAGDYHLKVGSPCIDAGDPNYVAAPTGISIPTGYYWPDVHDPDDYIAKQSEADLDGLPRVVQGTVDMGAYESSAPGEQARYDIIDLGTLGGEESMAHAINNNNQIVGWARTYPHAITACLFDYTNPADNIDLDPYGGISSGAYAINIHGVPVGTARRTQTGPFHATLFNPSDPCDNVDLDGSENHVSSAESINDSGQIVGWEQLPTGEHRATLFDATGAGDNIDLTGGGLWEPDGLEDSSAISINNQGKIVGYARTGTTSVVQRAVLFDQTGAGNNIILTPDEDDEGEARCINDAGQIVGWSKKTGGATLFNQDDPGNNLPLGAVPVALDSKAHSINNRGQIVGSVRFWEEALSYYDHAAIFDPSGNADNRDLNELIDYNTGWELSVAYGINDAGWIVGYGRYQGGTRAFLLVPRKGSRLVAHWKLDESEGDIAEDSAGDNDGTLQGGPLWLPNQGRVEGALLFDGEDDYVNCGNSSDFDITDQISVAAWVNIGSINMDWQTVVAKGDSAWRLSTAEDEYRYHFAVTGGPPWNYINGETEVQPGEWHHVCGTYDGAYLRLYIDCVEDPAGPVAEANGVTTSNHAVYIGENQERTGRHWDGLIDDVRVYNYTLTRAEISQLCKTEILYVDEDARGRNNGCCWADAFRCLQDALAAATDGTEIRVAQGRYTPDSGDEVTFFDRNATFQLKNGVTIKGGYAGHDQPEPNARNISQHRTILSGDLLGNDAEITDPCRLSDEPTRTDNSRHIITAEGIDRTAILDGLTIAGGYAQYGAGAGMYNNNASPTINECTFEGNFAERGGAMSNTGNSNPLITNCNFYANAKYSEEGGNGGAMVNSESSPTLTNCTFTKNWSAVGIPDHGGGYGGAIANYEGSPTLIACTFTENTALCGGGAVLNDYRSTPTITDCTFERNVALGGGDRWAHGGAMHNDHGSPRVTNCTFVENTGRDGGAIHNAGAKPVFENCIFSRNTASDLGGAMYSRYRSDVKVANCTFASNQAPRGNAFACYTYRPENFSTLEITNSIIWDGENSIWKSDDSTIEVAYSDVQYGYPGLGNIDADPCFVDASNGDYHLKSFGWRWDDACEEWTFDRVTSRCIDAGNPASPLGEEPLTVPDDPNNEFGVNLRINMGAYGGTEQASMAPHDWAILADINNDGTADFCDFACAGPYWLKSAPHQPCDLDRNGNADPADLELFSTDWLKATLWRGQK